MDLAIDRAGVLIAEPLPHRWASFAAKGCMRRHVSMLLLDTRATTFRTRRPVIPLVDTIHRAGVLIAVLEFSQSRAILPPVCARHDDRSLTAAKSFAARNRAFVPFAPLTHGARHGTRGHAALMRFGQMGAGFAFERRGSQGPPVALLSATPT